MEIEVIKIGVVGVNSGQLMICDPCYIDSEFMRRPEVDLYDDFAHAVYQHKTDGKLWQFGYGKQSSVKNVNRFPGSYEELISEYDMKPNDLIKSGIFVKTDLDPTPHIPENEFSYRSICKANKENFGQLNFALGHPGVAVAFSSGLGDGTYDVFAEVLNHPKLGKRVKKVFIELITDDELSDYE